MHWAWLGQARYSCRCAVTIHPPCFGLVIGGFGKALQAAMDGGLNLRGGASGEVATGMKGYRFFLQQNAWGEGKGMLRQGWQVLKDCYWMRPVDTT